MHGFVCKCAAEFGGDRCQNGLSIDKWMVLVLVLAVSCGCGSKSGLSTLRSPRLQLLVLTRLLAGAGLVALTCVRKRRVKEAEQSAIDAQSLILGSVRTGRRGLLPSPSPIGDGTVGACQPIV